MKPSQVFILILGIVFATNGARISKKTVEGESEGPRLIQTSETEPARWMSEAEIFALIRNRQGFMDVTDFDYGKNSNGNGNIGIHGYTALPREVRFRDKVEAAKALLNPARVKDFVVQFSAYFNRHYRSETGRESQLWLLSLVQEALSSYRGQSQVEEVDHDYPQKSVVARLLGNDPTLRNEVVILGAHLDSITQNADTLAPGADDNASGSVVLLETLRTIVESGFVPNRTVEFQFYAAEEVGLRGSQAIAQLYLEKRVNVISMMNLDVVGYHVNGTDDISIYTDYASEEVVNFLRAVATAYVDYGWRDNYCGYACSDHASWDRNGFPAAMVGEVYDSPYMHTVRDTLENMSLEQVHEFIKLGIGYVIELGEPVTV